MDHAVVAADVGGPARRLGRTLRLEADDSIVEPGLAEAALVLEDLPVQRRLVPLKHVQRLPPGNDVVFEHVGGDRPAALALVLLKRGVRRGEQGEVSRAEGGG
jgi:hypothetical protein